ncbi:MAG TPA: DUF3617 domain-containing protein [Acidobacteriaceae bacterium]|jgi:hypothetical protein|nr:DUF3617 domain-containing protein [Acidobacteriaceae bacterium]
MGKTRTGILVCSLLLIGAVVAWAQGRKPGLWEITSTVTLQQSPLPPGMQMPASSPLAAGPHTAQVCLTQAMIDKYGAPLPQSSSTECTFSNISKTDHGMTADLICSGRMTGKGTVESSWSDPEHAKGTTHFTGTVTTRNGTAPIEWTRDSTSVFKSADCGDVKPLLPPEK